tara:strand:+ start:88 stop:297 length:210 start_codon:yes stop_codon:yes gene_type:complete
MTKINESELSLHIKDVLAQADLTREKLEGVGLSDVLADIVTDAFRSGVELTQDRRILKLHETIKNRKGL